ncbi:MAG: response regulator transcription factor [Ruminococcaceae bacterium]|nr:response regulator transcription factor [Oscillospiraceae bacterium]
MRILVVEDERDMNSIIVKVLKKAGYSVDGCYNGEQALEHLFGAEYDGVIADIMMPKMDGYELLRRMRSGNIDVPVLFLTAKDTVADKVAGLDMGADDYLVKPFDFDELLARLRVITRKKSGVKSNIFTVADLTVDVARRTVTRGGVETTLLPKEFTILEYMIRNRGIVISRQQLEDKIWNYEYSGSSNNIDAYMSRLRKKIDGEREDKLIHTVKGSGWVLRSLNEE